MASHAFMTVGDLLVRDASERMELDRLAEQSRRLLDGGACEREPLSPAIRVPREENARPGPRPAELAPRFLLVRGDECPEIDAVRDDVRPNAVHDARHLLGLHDHPVHDAREEQVRARLGSAVGGHAPGAPRRVVEKVAPEKRDHDGTDALDSGRPTRRSRSARARGRIAAFADERLALRAGTSPGRGRRPRRRPPPRRARIGTRSAAR